MAAAAHRSLSLKTEVTFSGDVRGEKVHAGGALPWDHPNSTPTPSSTVLGRSDVRQIHFLIKNLKIQLMSKRTPECTNMEVASVDMAVFIGWPTVRENNP